VWARLPTVPSSYLSPAILTSQPAATLCRSLWLAFRVPAAARGASACGRRARVTPVRGLDGRESGAPLSSSLNVAIIGRCFNWVPSVNFCHALHMPVLRYLRQQRSGLEAIDVPDLITLGHLRMWSLHMHLHLRVQGR